MYESSLVKTSAHRTKQAPASMRIGVHVHGHVGAFCGAEQEEGGPHEGFIHVEEILGGSFGVCEKSDCIPTLYSSCFLMC